MSNNQSWIADPALERRMGRNAYRLLCVMVKHAYGHRRLFLKPEHHNVYALKPHMSRRQMGWALTQFQDMNKLTQEERQTWATKRLAYLETGGLGGGWIKCERRNYPGNPNGATRFVIPLRLLKRVGVVARRARTRLLNISRPSGLTIKSFGAPVMKLPAVVAEILDKNGSLVDAFRALKSRGVGWAAG